VFMGGGRVVSPRRSGLAKQERAVQNSEDIPDRRRSPRRGYPTRAANMSKQRHPMVGLEGRRMRRPGAASSFLRVSRPLRNFAICEQSSPRMQAKPELGKLCAELKADTFERV